MDTNKLKFTRLQNEIFRLLCVKAGTDMNQREIASELDVSPTAVAKSLELLEKEGLAKVERSKTMNLVSVQLNRDNHKAIALKRVENLSQIYESGLSDYLEEHFPGCMVVLFGSYSFGEDTTISDIDIAVIGSKEKDVDLIKFEKALDRTINIQHYDSLNSIHKNLRENILNGITLHGAVEL